MNTYTVTIDLDRLLRGDNLREKYAAILPYNDTGLVSRRTEEQMVD